MAGRSGVSGVDGRYRHADCHFVKDKRTSNETKYRWERRAKAAYKLVKLLAKQAGVTPPTPQNGGEAYDRWVKEQLEQHGQVTMTTLTQEKIDERYPLWQCEMRAYHEFEDVNGYTAHIYKVWRDRYGKSREYMFSCDSGKAHSVCTSLNRNSREWRPVFNSIGAVIN